MLAPIYHKIHEYYNSSRTERKGQLINLRA